MMNDILNLEPSESCTFEVIVPSTEFKSMTLEKFSITRHFEIGLMNALTYENEDFLDKLVNLNSTRESVTHISFIKKEEVDSFIEEVASRNANFVFPPTLIKEVQDFVQYRDMENEADENEAYSMKFKLIHKMYGQYAAAIRTQKIQESLRRELDMLAEKKLQTGPKHKRSRTDLKLKSSAKKMADEREEDYTDIELMENDTVIDDILDHRIHFYIFYGYDNMNILKNVLKKTKLSLSFIIQISESELDERKEHKIFWQSLDDIRNSSSDFLQKVALMKYRAPDIDGDLRIETCLKELIGVIKKIIDLKRLHFQYIKNLKLIDTKFNETFREYPVYEKLMETYPLETITIPLVLHSMLQEVQIKFDNTLTSKLFHTEKKVSKQNIMPCSFDIHKLKRVTAASKNEPPIKESFKIYEKDLLNLTFKSYQSLNYSYVRNNLEILKLQEPLVLAKADFHESIDDFKPHTHSAIVPDDEDQILSDEQVEYLINLLYLKNFCLGRKEHQMLNVNEDKDNELIQNFIVHDEERYARRMFPRCLDDEPWNTSNVFKDNHSDANVHESTKPMALHWAEILSSDVLCQYLFDSQLEFTTCDYIMCPITNSVLLRFHNDVDSFGLHTKVWKDYLRTPVGLGDFCKFTLKDDYNWLKANGVYPQILFSDVMKMIEDQTAMRLYKSDENYQYKKLLIPQIQYSNSDIRKTSVCPCIEENVCKILENCGELRGAKYQQISANLEFILRDLEEYKNIIDLSEHCKRKSDEKHSYAAYNFGLTKFTISGHTTDFFSLDSVKLTIDTSRFCKNNFKIMLKIASEGNLIVLHYPRGKFSFHVFLPDETLIVFSKPAAVEDEKTSIPKEDFLSTISEPEDDFWKKLYEEPEKKSLDYGITPGYPLIENSIIAMDSEHYSSAYSHPIVGNIERKSPDQAHKPKIKREVEILKQLQENSECFKVSKKFENLKYLRKNIPEKKVPLSEIVKRIINDPEKPDNCESPRMRCNVKNFLKKKEFPASYNCSITIPNGMTIKFLPSEALPDTLIVEQTFEYAPAPEKISEEKFRMFTEDGYIIIGRIDGTIHLLTSSGKEIRFGKITSEDDHNCQKHRRRIDENLMRKVLARIMSRFPNQTATDHCISRRGHLTSQYRYIKNEDLPQELSTIPYSTISIINFEGEKITLKNNKLTKVRHCQWHTSEISLQTERISFKREDGFESAIIDKDGKQYVKFPDGTLITSSIHIREEPIRLSIEDEMGWILISSTLTYEHPFYKPVSFENNLSMIEIGLGENEKLKLKKTGCVLEMSNSTALDIRTDYLYFRKTCDFCTSKYECDIFVDPLYRNKKPQDDSTFVFARDSFGKKFKTNFLGQCRVNTDYIHGPLNMQRCSFHQRPKNHFHKIFLLKNDKTGMLLWNDKYLSAVMKESEQDKKIQISNDTSNMPIFLTIQKNISTKYDERFFGEALKPTENHVMEPSSIGEVYQTTRNLYSMFDIDKISALLKCLKKYTQEPETKELTQSIISLKFNLSASRFISHSSLLLKEPEEDKNQSKSIDHQFDLMQRIIAMRKKQAQVKKIMRTPIPKYFNSEFCTFSR